VGTRGHCGHLAPPPHDLAGEARQGEADDGKSQRSEFTDGEAALTMVNRLMKYAAKTARIRRSEPLHRGPVRSAGAVVLQLWSDVDARSY
jgi:hypothetical protein